MRIIVSGKNMDVTPSLKDKVEKKLSKFDKFFGPNSEAHATLSVEKNRHTIEVMIPFNGSLIRGEESTEDMYTSIDKVIEKIERQMRKQKTKLERKHKSSGIDFSVWDQEFVENEPEKMIVKSKKFAYKPMPSEEAVLQMELLGHSFFVFENANTEEVNVVYKRKDGHYGLIEPGF